MCCLGRWWRHSPWRSLRKVWTQHSVPWLFGKVVFAHRLDSTISEAFSILIDSVILQWFTCLHTNYTLWAIISQIFKVILFSKQGKSHFPFWRAKEICCVCRYTWINEVIYEVAKRTVNPSLHWLGILLTQTHPPIFLRVFFFTMVLVKQYPSTVLF